MRNDDHRTEPGRARGHFARWALALALMIPLAGCDLLEVNNPNNLTQEDVLRVDASSAITRGAQSTVSAGIAEMGGPYSTVTDELTWIGSRDAWNQLDVGSLDDPANEFVDRAFPFLAEGRWMADEAIAVNRDHVSESNTSDLRQNLAESLFWGGVIYTAIGDMMEDFAFSDRMEAGPAVGPDNMGSVYQTGIDYFTEAIGMAQADGFAELELRATAMRARAMHAQGVWQCLHGAGGADCPLTTAGSADAATVVASEGFSDWMFRLDFNSATIHDAWQSMQFQVNERGELQIGPTYVTLDAEDAIQDTIFADPISGEVDARFEAAMVEFLGGGQFSPITQASNREMHLILAEAALANGNVTGAGGFVEHINHVREEITGLDDAYTGPGQLDPMLMLEHERQANLFLQNRRLADHYRFDSPPPEWPGNSFAGENPGAGLPITCIEVRANPNINTPGC